MSPLKENPQTSAPATKKRWEAPAILVEQSLVARAQDPNDSLGDSLFDPADDPFLGALNNPTD